MRHVSDARPGRARRLLVAFVLAGFALASVAAATRAVAAPGPDPASAPPFGVDGLWTGNGTEEHVVTAVNDTIFVDVRRPRRPDATGTVPDASRTLVSVPDDDTYLGTFVTPTFIRWSNGSASPSPRTSAAGRATASTWTSTEPRRAGCGRGA